MSTKLYDISNWCRQGIELEGYPYIVEIDIVLSVGSVVKIGNKYYAAGVLSHVENSAGVREIKLNLKPDDKDYENNVTCPYCGYKDADSWELSDGEDEHECGRCGATMSYERIVTVEYNSSPKRPPEIVKARWINK